MILGPARQRRWPIGQSEINKDVPLANVEAFFEAWRGEYITMQFQPDYNNVIKAARNIEVERFPLYEHKIDPKVMERVTGKQFADPVQRR